MVTIKDVAKEANVAISTVSNVLNNVDVVSPLTRIKVLEAVKKLNYTPNLNGKYLKMSKTGFIGLFLTTVGGPFFGKLISKMHKECRKAGYGLTIFLNDDTNIEKSVQAILGKRVDGAIILNETVTPEHIQTFENLEMPIVFLDREIEHKKIKSVVIDNEQGMYLVVNYLLNLGHKNIGYIHGVLSNYDEIQRYKGYRKALEENDIAYNKNCELQGFYSENDAYKAIQAYVNSKKPLPTAIVAANDQMACGCIDGLKDLGYKVPQDVSIIGFDNIEKGRYYNPTLTTIDPNADEIAMKAVKVLLDLIQANNTRSHIVPVKLLTRKSCKFILPKEIELEPEEIDVELEIEE
ncbi:MAG: hypothetical protein ATN31_06175 [Candidatus Epulonipiscioides saccharophilum]|nr:MAG: hypothetical protein ATN31_06175 [Epulopiscium sp. AS2M-Bin001]